MVGKSRADLRAVEQGEAPPALPKKAETLVAALEADDRRQMLVLSRQKVADALDKGVPAHSLVRMLAELERLDTEIRRIDAVAAGQQGTGAEGDAAAGSADDDGEDQAFDAASL